jgi:hypothetical protein
VTKRFTKYVGRVKKSDKERREVENILVVIQTNRKITILLYYILITLWRLYRKKIFNYDWLTLFFLHI